MGLRRMMQFLISMLKITPILFALLLLSCKEELGKKEQECDAACEDRRKEFERSIDSVHFDYDYSYLLVKKTDTGASIEYLTWNKSKNVTAELSENEWLTFINSIYKCCIYKNYNEYYKHTNKDVKMKLRMNYSNKDIDFNEFIYCSEQSNWDEIKKIMGSIVEIIRKKNETSIEAKLKSEYQKRFGEPISDIELSTNEIDFSLYGVVVTRTKTGAIADLHKAYTELSIGEWLDFVRALYKLGVYEWDKEYGECKEYYNKTWLLKIYFSYKIDFNISKGCLATPPNWGKFLKIMRDMRTKITIDSSGKELKSNLKSEYQERFKMPITNIELSTNKIQFYTTKENDGNRVSDTLSVTRTLDGAFAEYGLLEAELDFGEWLDFIRSLYKLRFIKWKVQYGDDMLFENYGIGGKWQLEVNYDDYKSYPLYGRGSEIRRGYDAYPPNWKEFKKLMYGMMERVRER